MAKSLGKSSINLEPNISATLSYAFGFITGIIFYLIEKENKFVRFHAMQSIIVFGGLVLIQIMNVSVLFFLPWVLHFMISMILGLGGLALWLILMIKAYQGEDFKLPIAGDIAEKHT